MTTFEHRMENANKRRKYDHLDTLEAVDPEVGWHLLQPILENDVLCAKIPTSSMAFDLLAKWFQIIVEDQDKLRLFRQWITSSADEDATKRVAQSPNQSLLVSVPLADIKKDEEEPVDERPTPLTPSPVRSISTPSSAHSSPSKVASIDFINNEIPITPRSTPQVLLLQQLLQQQQQQIVLLQKLKSPTDSVVPTANTITLSSSSGSAGVVLTVNIKGTEWHAYSDTCTCTCGFTTTEGTVSSSNRIPGGNECEMRFVVPPISFPSLDVTQIPMTVHLTACSAPHAPLVCVDSFMYGRERPSAQPASSDEDSEDTPDSSVCDDEENDEDSERSPVAPSSLSSPKQLMTIRERMVEFAQSPTKATAARVTVAQQPPSRVVWKNRRLDTPFKVRVEGVTCDTPSTKLAVLALVVDHKSKLQIDAMENFEEECSPLGIALFHNLRMTKGTWGKEWSITFVVVVKVSMTTSAPVVVGVSQACPVVVKTRKNPQVRHITRSEAARSETPSPVSFVERKPDTTIRLKRNRVEDILDNPQPRPTSISPATSATSSSSRTGHSEAMSNLLYAAEIKQHEREFRVIHHPLPPTALSSSSSASPSPSSSPSPPQQSSLVLPSIQSGFVNPDPNFANLQGLLGFLEEIKLKHHPSLVVLEQPQLKRDGKVLIVKKGKPFRTPFRLQMRTTQQRTNFNTAPDYNPQQYVCVAVLRNDKGEEVALKNNEVSFDARGLATFSGLMVMKGTWGKTVQLTFEARWSGARRIVGGSNWPPLRMLVVSETQALQLMCYTKDKKAPSAV